MGNFDHRSGSYLEIEGARIYYEIKGRDEDPALLFLHGGLGSIEDFAPITSRLQRPFRSIGVDGRGQGMSTLGAPPLTYERMQTDAELVVKHLGLQKFGLIGFSDGGIVALRMAAKSGAKIDKIVTIGAHFELAPEDPVRAIYAKVTADGWRKKFPETYEHYQSLNPSPDFDTLVKAMVGMWMDDTPTGYPQRTIKKITNELLVVRGDEDHLVSRAGAFELVQQVESAKLLMIPFAGHVAHDDQPEIVMTIVNRFLDGN